MRKYFVKIVTLALVFMLAVCIVGCGDIPPLSQEQIEFNELCSVIEELETLSEEYNSEDYIKRALIYIRSGKYNSQEWKLIGGDTDTDFDAYVQKNQEKDVSELKTKESFVIPSTKESVDFVHMFATINVNFIDDEYAQSDLSGWGGDLFQLAASIKDCGKTGTELKQYIESLFNSETGAFNSQDVCADLDAVNIAKLLKTNKTSIKDTMSAYYNNLSSEYRKGDFITNVFSKNYTDLNSLKQDIYSRVKNNNFLIFWGIRNNFSTTEVQNLNILEECCNVFAEYLYN